MTLIRDGTIMLILLAVIFICWYVLSTPFEDVISSVEDLNLTASDTRVDEAGGWVRTVWDMVFAGLCAITIIWFIIRVFSREPDWRY